MTVFDVYVNGRRCCRAGVGADGVLTAIMNWVKLTGPAARNARRCGQSTQECSLHVGGLSRGMHRVWLERNLTVGDRVAVAVCRGGTADRPLRQRSAVAQPSRR